MKRFHLFSILLGALLLVFLVWAIGARDLWRNLSLLGWGFIPFILILSVADLFHTLGWRHCLPAPHRSLPFSKLYSIWMAGYAVNYLTPTAELGGEVTKGTLLSMHHRGPEAVTGVVVGKLAHAMSELLFAIVGSLVLLWGIELPPGVWTAMLIGSALLGLSTLTFLAVQKYGKLGSFLRWLAAHGIGGKLLQRTAVRITQVDESLKLFYSEHPLDLPIAILWHFVGLTCGIVQCVYFLYLLTEDPSLVLAAGIWFFGAWVDLLSFAIPIDLGYLEASRVVVFTVLGYSSALGLSYGISLRLARLFRAGVGLLLYGVVMKQKAGGHQETRSANRGDGRSGSHAGCRSSRDPQPPDS
jgi:uncharacterized protein (TIRG00374 family)